MVRANVPTIDALGVVFGAYVGSRGPCGPGSVERRFPRSPLTSQSGTFTDKKRRLVGRATKG
jgi:hypothetical protein